MVEGDLFPECVTKYSDLLAVPLTKIYNMILASRTWPSPWKKETVTVIPKSPSASTFEECRNLSCTPLFSKLMESYLMEMISSEVKVDTTQYGGIKRCGTEHFLLQAWNNILTTLEDNRSSMNLITIDYAKAFNRMSHQHCLQAFKVKGASQLTIDLIAAFLKGRTMQVKVGEAMSEPRPIQGGSPQGCVTANVLFCATIEALQSGQLEQVDQTADVGVLRRDERTNNITMYAGDTLLFDIPSEESTDEYVVPFEYNGITTDTSPLSKTNFNPRSISSPFLNEFPGYSRSHYEVCP